LSFIISHLSFGHLLVVRSQWSITAADAQMSNIRTGNDGLLTTDH
jgi:hypothetical protein